jgi:hypothetical protein
MNRRPSLAGPLVAALLMVPAGCLSVLDAGRQDDGGRGATTGAGNGTSGSGTTGTGSGPGSSSAGEGSASAGSSSGGGSSSSGTSTGAGCTYPLSAGEGRTLFPDETLGLGWVNFTGAADSSATIGSESDALLQLHCSRERYALIAILAGWCPQCQQFATNLAAGSVAGWLAEGGVVFSVLEQNASQQPAAQMDLTTWASQYQVTYSLLGDPTESLGSVLAIQAWPTFYVIRLSDMAIVYTLVGNRDALEATFSAILAGTFDGGL